MLNRVRGLLRARPVAAVGASLALHLVLLGVALVARVPRATYVPRPGEAVFVELPQLPEPAPAGNPADRSRGGRTPEPPAPARPAPEPPQAVVKVPPPLSPRVPERPAVVASRAPEPPPPAVPPAPPRETPPAAELRREPPAPETPAAPEPSEAVATVPAPAPREPAKPGPPKPEDSSPPGAERAPSIAPGPERALPPQVAALPPVGEAPVDVRSALRRGAGGSASGTSEGRGGIEGEPIPLDSRDPRHSDYLERVRRRIKAHWGYPCVDDPRSRDCQYKSAQLVVEFGIAKDGRVPFVTVVRSSGWAIYDDYAVNAIKLASPFPPVPDSLSRRGIPILATFNYILDTSLTNLLLR